MKYVKLFIISIIVFGLMIFLISLLFPSVTYVSRAMNSAGGQDATRSRLPQLFSRAFNNQNPKLAFVKDYLPNADTLQFYVKDYEQVSGGIAIYAMGNDSSTIQVFYKITVPWYKPWQKFGLMINEQKYGPSLDTALYRMKEL